jgi:hypothetical protein
MKPKEIGQKYKEKYIKLFGKSFYHDILMVGMFTTYVLILITMLLLLIFKVRAGSGAIPLSYNVIYGVTSLGSWINLYLYLIGYAILGFLNLFVAWAFFEKERLISYLMGLTNIVIGVLFVIVIYNLTALISP